MTETNLKPEDAIRFALMLVDEQLAPLGARVELIKKSLQLSGYEIVPAGGCAPPVIAAKPPPPPKPRGPIICQKCNRVRGNGGDADSCDDTACPF